MLFVCQHGSAKSVIAAAFMQRLARERGVALDCRSAGVDPDEVVPPHVLQGLLSDDIDVSELRPAQATREGVATAAHVISFGCDVARWDAGTVRHWDDVPPVSDGYARARDVIVARLTHLLDEIRAARVEGPPL